MVPVVQVLQTGSSHLGHGCPNRIMKVFHRGEHVIAPGRFPAFQSSPSLGEFEDTGSDARRIPDQRLTPRTLINTDHRKHVCASCVRHRAMGELIEAPPGREHVVRRYKNALSHCIGPCSPVSGSRKLLRTCPTWAFISQGSYF